MRGNSPPKLSPIVRDRKEGTEWDVIGGTINK
jgi:hypothetical protein